LTPDTNRMLLTEGPDDPHLLAQLNRLRFDAPLEDDFRADYEIASLHSRLVLLVMSLAAVALTPLYDALFLHPPQAFVGVSRLIQFGLEVPVLLAGLLLCLPSLRRWLPLGLILGTLTIAGGLIAQRVIGAAYGYSVPFDFAAVTIAALYTLGRVRFPYAFVTALVIAVAAITAEVQTFGNTSSAFYNCISLFIIFVMLSSAGYLLERTARENWIQRLQLLSLAKHDWLTGLPNRRHFEEALVKLLRAAARERSSVALMVLDIDDFKTYNDRYGHPAGDACLRQIGEWLKGQMRRPHDFCARIGGEEFAAVWWNPTPPGALMLAENLRSGIKALGIVHAAGGSQKVITASGGLVEVIAPQPEAAARGIAQQMISRADALLYHAKGAGRDQLITEETASAAAASSPAAAAP